MVLIPTINTLELFLRYLNRIPQRRGPPTRSVAAEGIEDIYVW